MTKKKTTKKTTKKAPSLRVPIDGPSSPAKAPPVDPVASTERPEKAREATGPGDGGTLPEGLRPFRDLISDAAYAEALEAGVSKRNALRISEGIADRLRCPDNLGEAPKSGFYDLREKQDYDYPHGKRKAKLRAPGVPVRRDPADVDTIVVHQTAVEFGVSKRAIANHGGDVELARAHRALDVACHAMAFRQGYFVAAHPLVDYVNHGNRFNATSLGLEIDGRYAGLEDDPKTIAREDLKTTWGGAPTVLSEDTIKAAKDAIVWLCVEAARKGMKITKIASHRQSSDTRRSDPGEAIWQSIVLPIADELGLEVLRDSPWKQGRPVPVEWDPKGIGEY